ncbi:uncharacterized protein LOC143283187 [Babylonia areolata]|uniref:uncharacterized protein LOC143283187 n=1 Tax=Babylonia areolata TaxID=304850 RepID=UPI003FD09910
MDMRGSHYVSCASYVDFSSVRMTSPTCEDLGIPTDIGEEAGGVYPFFTRRIIHNPSLHLDGLRYDIISETHHHKITDPYSPLCMIPLPGALALHSSAEPSFIRKRNERERERVRCVNEGYERLKEHLPNTSKDKRISKVETLRGAIDYIRELQRILDEAPPLPTDSPTTTTTTTTTTPPAGDHNDGSKLRLKPSASNKTAAAAEYPRMQHSEDGRGKKRRGSLSSEQSALSDGTVTDGTLSESEDEPLSKRSRLL